MSLSPLRSRARIACLVVAMAAASLGTPPARGTFDLLSLGRLEFTVDPGGTSATYTQTDASLDFSGSYALGATLAGSFAEQDWSLYSTFALRMMLTGDNPNLPFTVEFYDASFTLIDHRFQGSTLGLGPAPGLAYLTRITPGSLDLSSVAAMQFTWDGADSIQVAVSDLVAAYGYFTASAPGGVRFINRAHVLTADPAASASGYWTFTDLPPGATSWSVPSDRNAKTDIAGIDHRETLRKVSALPVTAWQYKHDPHRRYIGPMAQDFHAAFGLGHDDKHIGTLDTDGVALSALKGIIEELRERKRRSAAQARRLAELEAELEALRAKAHGRGNE